MDTTEPRTAENLAARFHDVDSSGVPEDFIAYLRKMEESESGRAVREVTYRALEAAEGKGADVGASHLVLLPLEPLDPSLQVSTIKGKLHSRSHPADRPQETADMADQPSRHPR
ncbi:hypothetical protein [Streptomyces capitiformicae]|uniref:hypothetical protein n=1 Tax=Streptomyces capitiformicae TaxID=2014920 RepID=UPI001AD8394B|nr:hypothetical protein [Streptomyces capitiformicae]